MSDAASNSPPFWATEAGAGSDCVGAASATPAGIVSSAVWFVCSLTPVPSIHLPDD
jgi:hypothetical protein